MSEGATATAAGPVVADASTHRLRPNLIGLPKGVLIGVATSAPGQSTAVVLALLVSTAAYGSAPAILVAMLPMAAIAFCYQRLNLFEQNCGGPYVWVGRSIGPSIGYLVAWAMLVGFVLGAISDILPLGPTLLSLVGLDVNGVAGNVLTVTLFGAALAVVAALGLRATTRFQIAIAAVEYTILLGFSLVAFYAVFVAHWPGTVHPSAAWLSPTGVGGQGSLANAMVLAIFLFSGWDAPMYLNEETTDRRRTPGRAVLLSVALLGPIYAGLFFTFQGVVGPLRLQAHQTDALTYVAGALGGSGWSRVMALALILSVLGTSQATLVALSRVTYSMGSDRLLPRPFARIHPRFGTPAWAAVFWGVVMIAVADLYAASSAVAAAFDDVANCLGIVFAAFFGVTALATTWYYRRLLRRGWADLVTVGVLPVAAAAVLGWVIANALPGLDSRSKWILVGLAAGGVVLMAFSRLVLRAPFFALRPSAWTPGVDEPPAELSRAR
jgi:amino acid transporter